MTASDTTFGDATFGDLTVSDTLIDELSRRLLQRGWRLCTAESCTGGGIASRLTDRPGSSAWFECAWVTYSNRAKTELLGVPAESIQTHGAVSAEVAAAMVNGALTRCHADIAMAVTGIAGPGGGSAEKPVGLVWFGWQRRGQPACTQSQQFPGTRAEVRARAAAWALNTLLDTVVVEPEY